MEDPITPEEFLENTRERIRNTAKELSKVINEYIKKGILDDITLFADAYDFAVRDGVAIFLEIQHNYREAGWELSVDSGFKDRDTPEDSYILLEFKYPST